MNIIKEQIKKLAQEFEYTADVDYNKEGEITKVIMTPIIQDVDTSFKPVIRCYTGKSSISDARTVKIQTAGYGPIEVLNYEYDKFLKAQMKAYKLAMELSNILELWGDNERGNKKNKKELIWTYPKDRV